MPLLCPCPSVAATSRGVQWRAELSCFRSVSWEDIFTSLLTLWEKVARTKSVPDEGVRLSIDRDPSPVFASRSHPLPQGEREKNLKFRRTLFRKGLDAFLDLGAVHAVAMAAVGGFFIQPVAGEFVDRALHAAHRGRGVGGEHAGELVDLPVEPLRGAHGG